MKAAANLCFLGSFMRGETEEFLAAHASVCFNYFPPQTHCMHQQLHIKVNCARKDMFNNQCSLECNWNIYMIRRLFFFFSGTVAETEARLELLSLTSRGGDAVFVTHLACVGCFRRVSSPFHRSSPRRLSSSAWQRRKCNPVGFAALPIRTWWPCVFSRLMTQVDFWLLLMKFICCGVAALRCRTLDE